MTITTVLSLIAIGISLGAILSNLFTRFNDLKHLEKGHNDLKEEVDKIRDCVEEVKLKITEIDTRCKERYGP